MTEQQTVQQTPQRQSRGSLIARLGEAHIAGEQRRLAKMNPRQRSRDASVSTIVGGFFTVISALGTLGVLISLFIAHPALRIPLVILVGLTFWFAFRMEKR